MIAMHPLSLILLLFMLSCLTNWFFFEIEPFMHYPREREFKQTLGLALRIEMNFKQ